jgi:ABC-type uncharacterized transport system permease subunit
MIDAFFLAAAVAYAVASAFLLSYLAGTAKPHTSTGMTLLALAALLHVVHDGLRWSVHGVPPYGGIAPAMSTLALLIAVGFLAVRYTRPRLEVVGAFITPVALVMFLVSRVHAAQGSLGGGASIALHVGSNLVAMAAFTVASAMAAAYLVQERQVKARKLGGLFHRLPPLETLDTYAFRCIAVGIPALTVGVITGHVVAARGVHGPGLPWQQYFAIVSWVLFMGVFLLRLLAGWRGRRAAIGTILGYASAVLVLLFYVVRGTRP